jgi:hypothetical protein
MTLKTALIVTLSLSFVTACTRVEETPYVEAPKPDASTVSYPAMAQGDVADGQVFEYH